MLLNIYTSFAIKWIINNISRLELGLLLKVNSIFKLDLQKTEPPGHSKVSCKCGSWFK